MSAGMGFQEHSGDQQSTSNTGVLPNERTGISQGAGRTAYISENLAEQFARSPFGYFQNQNIRSLVPQNQYGLPVETTQALNALGNQWFNKASAGGAMRGQVTPENTNQIVGSAMLNGAQFLVPQILQNQQYLNALPDQLASQRMGYLQADMDSRSRLLGSSSQSSGSQYGYGFNVQGGVGGGGGSSTGMNIAGMQSTVSDRRLKSNIERIGTHPLGIGWYRYTINNQLTEGVMADELIQVQPDAVHVADDGFYRVHYEMIGRL